MFTQRFEAVAAIEEWISTVQFTYVGGGSAQNPTVFELSNKKQHQQQQQSESARSRGSDNSSLATSPVPPQTAESAATTTTTTTPAEGQFAEQLVEALVCVIQAGMRTGLRGPLEVVKILDRLPECVFVPVPTVAFTAAGNLGCVSPWFRTMDDFHLAIAEAEQQQQQQQPGGGGGDYSAASSQNLRDCELVALPLKMVRSALFVVNACANNDESPHCKTAGGQLRMFLRLCLQQRCLLAVVELLVGFLRGNDFALADFLYTHPTATPLLDDLAFPPLFDLLRKFGGPPLVVRASAHLSEFSIGPLLESPWDPDVQVACAENPIVAAWSMWVASKGLRLKWDLEYNLPSDAAHADYVPEPTSAGSATSATSPQQHLSTLSSRTMDGPTPRTNRGEGGDFDDDRSSVAGGEHSSGKKVIRRVVVKKRAGTHVPNSARVANPTSPALRTGTADDTTPRTNFETDQQFGTPSSSSTLVNRRDRVRTITMVPAAATGSGSGTSSARGGGGGDSARRSPPPPPISVANQQQQQQQEEQQQQQQQQQKKPVVVTDEQIAESVAVIHARRRTDVAAVDTAAARWKQDAAAFKAARSSELAQPLLEAYASLVFAKWSAALANAAVSEARLMECQDRDAGRGGGGGAAVGQTEKKQHQDDFATPVKQTTMHQSQQQQSQDQKEDLEW